MAHACRRLMDPPPSRSFEQVYRLLEMQPMNIVHLRLRSGARGDAMAGVAWYGRGTDHGDHQHDTEGMRYIEFPRINRVYECCWGNENNHLGREGQWIGHFVRNLELWIDGLTCGK